VSVYLAYKAEWQVIEIIGFVLVALVVEVVEVVGIVKVGEILMYFRNYTLQ